ncbi:MAG: 5'/3'-nucleotidase SurE [Clostridia bacterium]|nr:5'/3'-nucleotidase SurE [Clostridia bacterium]MBQ3228838.1 5'/3'-nucleotidase SurE [Clostridia bacterium]
MRILITNDDGIGAEGIRALVDWAQKLGDVSVFAPNVEKSGKSVSVELREAFKVEKVEYPGAVEAYSVYSTPADCVRFAVLGLGKKFDLVLSGVNKGQNLGHDINYSGTAGAVTEAAMHGINGIAVSASKKGLETAKANFDRVYDYFVEKDLFSFCKTWNVNFPTKEVLGIEITRQGGVRFSDEYEPIGDDMYMPHSYVCFELTGNKEVDLDAVNMGYVSITPITWSRTDMKVFEKLK